MANWPTSVSTDANLYIAKNNLTTALNGAIDNIVTTITVISTTGFPTTGYITIDQEAISYTGINATQFTGCTRGADGTTAASHLDAASVDHTVVAAHHNLLKDEVIALESSLDLTANRALQSSSSGRVQVSSVTSTELGYLSGATSSIQTQLNNTQTPRVDGLAISTVGEQNHLIWFNAVLVNSTGGVQVSRVNNSPGYELRTLDRSTSGVNGLDTGTATSNTWYYVWLIGDGTNVNGLYSLSRTNPTLPSGYTYKAICGAIRINATSNLVSAFQVGDLYMYNTQQQFVSDTTNNGAGTQTVDLDLHGSAGDFLVPPDNSAWTGDFSAILVADYSTSKSVTLGAVLISSLMPTGGNTICDDFLYQNGTWQRFSQIPNVALDEDTRTIKYSFSFESSELTSYQVALYIRSFRFRFQQ